MKYYRITYTIEDIFEAENEEEAINQFLTYLDNYEMELNIERLSEENYKDLCECGYRLHE